MNAFADEHFHTSVPRHDPSYAALYSWILTQRFLWKCGNLSPVSFRRLSALPGFTWDRQEQRWLKSFLLLASYASANGGCTCVKFRGDSDTDARLARWVAKQRYYAKRGMLSDGRRRRLEGLGFRFEGDDVFGGRANQILKVELIDGWRYVPESWPEDQGFARWASDVRRRWLAGRLKFCEKRSLVEARFCFEPSENVEWEAFCRSLEMFVRIRECLPVFIEDPELVRWIAKQKVGFERGDIEKERVERLGRIGLDMRGMREVFGERLCALTVFRERQGGWDGVEDSDVAVWARAFRARGRKALSMKNQEALDRIGFPW